ncbi:cation diffusion facilitator family transporter [Litorimonas taeanensis]|uniref:Cation diffusion facilitator family transporter n=1 Tax=Litorimonas taeanensis TaxID=568099 RepID=A0A420WDS1_9PROT|nr:cation diffusion facilitator family transporter [Litorimonas taeanensis]RKQ69143.1 cation diffusion facilitator family transporter [Litorimonas taeanensis]
MSAAPDSFSSTEDTRFDKPDRRGLPGRLPPESASRITRRITALAVIVGLTLTVSKIFLWQGTHSIGVLSSLVHSGLDMFGAVSSFIAVRYAAKKPDGQYRFGRGKAESFSAVFQVCLIIFAAFHLFEEVIERIDGHQHISNSALAILAMGVFIIITIWLIIAQSWAIRATGSIAVRGDRAHYLADLFANIFVILGLVISSFTPFIWADAAVGTIMAIWLLFTAYRVGRLAWAQLMDMELGSEERALIIRLAMADPRVRAVTELRTRASGPHIHIQMRLDMDETLSLSEAHDIIINAERRLMGDFQAADILIHPHPAGCSHSHGNRRFFTDEEAQDDIV